MIKIDQVKISNFNETIRNIGLSYDTVGKYDTAVKLAKRKPCSGHDSFLKGITVNFLLTAPHYFIIEMQRYHFLDIVMSTSKMHSLKKWKFVENNLPDEIDQEIKAVIELLWQEYNNNPSEDNFRKLLNNLPLGMTLTMYITTNYLQLKNIYYQRKDHKLTEWRIFCRYIKSLPLFEEILN